MEQLQIIKRCQLGDLEAFEELYKLYIDRVLKTSYLISGQRGIAEDIVQEAFIQCYKEIKRLKNPETFNSWFYRILVRCGWRMASKYKNIILVDSVEEGMASNHEDEVVETMEMVQKVNKSLEKLSIPLRTVVVLYYYNEMSIKDISTILGCFQGTVKSRLYNARKQIKKDLSNYFNEENQYRIIYDRKECNNNG